MRGVRGAWGRCCSRICIGRKRMRSGCWRQGIRIRLCKGAYKEPAEVAFPAKADVDANYVKLMKRMATSGVFCGIATHDEAIVEEMRQFVARAGLAKSAFEFQMLYGIRRDLQRQVGGGGVWRAGVCAVRDGVVSVLHAAAGGEAGECAVPGEEFLPELKAWFRVRGWHRPSRGRARRGAGCGWSGALRGRTGLRRPGS